jgi:hypothetical protein
MKMRQIIFWVACVSTVVSACYFAMQSTAAQMFADNAKQMLEQPIKAYVHQEKESQSGTLPVPTDHILHLEKAVYVIPQCIADARRSALVFVVSVCVVWFSWKKKGQQRAPLPSAPQTGPSEGAH